VTPLGSTRPIPVDVRLIAATNRDMDAEVRAGRFRADLFYRLNVVHIEVPPLRARRDDIPDLVTHFLRLYSERYRVAPKRIAPDALARINTYDWPGNVRELQNAIERAFALSAADVIGMAELPPAVAGRATRFPLERTDGSLPTLAEAEARLVAAALAESDGNKNEAARRLGIDRQRLYRKISKYGLG
jgi:two-component system response regulator HydG